MFQAKKERVVKYLPPRW